MDGSNDMAYAPGIEIPRASFNRSSNLKTTIDFDYIYPIYWDEVYPNDTFNMSTTAFGRFATLLYPLMDNAYIDIHYFFVPMRIVWDNARKFWGEQANPGDSIAFTIPSMSAPAVTGYVETSLFDYFDLPTKVPGYQHQSLPLRCYNFIWNEWYRDQNLQNALTVKKDDSVDSDTLYTLQKRGKRHDYFTGGLVELQEGGTSTSLPLGTTAPIVSTNLTFQMNSAVDATMRLIRANGPTVELLAHAGAGNMVFGPAGTLMAGLEVDLTNATAATILQLRQAAAIQKVLELDARAGTRFPEMIYAVYGVVFDDVTYRPEFLGGNSSQIQVQQVAQTSNDAVNGNVGDLGAYGTLTVRNAGFTKSFTEPGYVIGLMSARADLTYSQGLRREWSRSTRYDFLHPLFQNIGDQATLVKEIYCQDPTTDTGATGTPDNERVFNYQERYAELKYKQNTLTGLFRQNATASLESWHLAEEFATLPVFNDIFIQSNTPVDRAIAVPSQPHLIIDIHHNLQCARPMHLNSIPGMGTSL